MSTVKSFRQHLGIPASTASTSDSALIIIDAQNEYASGALTVTNAEKSGKVIADLLDRYRKANGGKGGKVIHVLHKTPEGAPLFTPGTDLAEEFKQLKPQAGETTIWKQYPGAFEQTPLHETLQSWGIKKIALVGYMAHVCVSTTAREGFQKGYEVILVEDGIGDRDIPGVKGDEVTRVALAELADVFGTVVGNAEIK